MLYGSKKFVLMPLIIFNTLKKSSAGHRFTLHFAILSNINFILLVKLHQCKSWHYKSDLGCQSTIKSREPYVMVLHGSFCKFDIFHFYWLFKVSHKGTKVLIKYCYTYYGNYYPFCIKIITFVIIKVKRWKRSQRQRLFIPRMLNW